MPPHCPPLPSPLAPLPPPATLPHPIYLLLTLQGLPVLPENAGRSARRAHQRALVSVLQRIVRAEASASSQPEIQAADLEEMLKEHDACGVSSYLGSFAGGGLVVAPRVVPGWMIVPSFLQYSFSCTIQCIYMANSHSHLFLLASLLYLTRSGLYITLVSCSSRPPS